VASPHVALAAVSRGFSRRLLTRAVVVAATAGLAVSLLPSSAHADPKVTAAQAQRQLQTLSDRAEILTEQFNAAQAKLDTAQRQLAADKAAIAKAQTAVDATKAQVARVASAAYESGGFDSVHEMLSSGQPEVALERAGILSMLADQRGGELRNATAARNKLAQTQAVAAQQSKQIQALQASLKQQQTTLDAMVKQQQALLKASQAQIAADNAKAAAAAAAKARANRSLVRAVVPKAAPKAAPRAAVAIPANIGADGRAAAALKYAYAQLGKPYRYGGAGPRSFDCSGLTMRAWQAAGVSISHNALAQYRSTQHVSRSQLQPGDLVYFGHPIHHVGIYIGGGKMIEAPYTGANVRITDFGYRHDYAGASRP
jgi:cell wall-associated NlpC family hydrolase